MAYKNNQLLLIFLSIVVLVQSIDIRTTAWIEVYSGPGGIVQPNYRKSSSLVYSKYDSTVSFTIMGTTLDEYLYVPIAEVFGPPTVKVVKGSDVVDPILYGTASSGYYFDSSNMDWLDIPDLGIYFNCQKDGNAQLEITISPSLINDDKVTNETITFYLQKDCYSNGYRDGFSIGKLDDRIDDVVYHGVVQSPWSIDSYDFYGQGTVIPDSEHFTFFRISISNPDYGNQYYDAPQVNVDNREILELQVRGTADNGGIATTVAETLVLFYTCKGEGEVNIVIVISLGIYIPIEFTFVKQCIGVNKLHENPSGVVNIGVSKSDYSNIVSNSRTSFEWSVQDSNIVVGTDDLLSIFYVSTLSGREQPFLSPIVSVYPNTAFKVTVSGTIRDGGVATGSPQRFVVNYICERVSEGKVVVSIKLPGFDTVEFSYTKKCVKLVRHHDHIWTANQILIALLAFIGGVLIVGIYILKRRKSELVAANRKNIKV